MFSEGDADLIAGLGIANDSMSGGFVSWSRKRGDAPVYEWEDRRSIMFVPWYFVLAVLLSGVAWRLGFFPPIGAAVAWGPKRLCRVIRSRLAWPAGHCVACGYDLRATPERCPECGAVSAGAK